MQLILEPVNDDMTNRVVEQKARPVVVGVECRVRDACGGHGISDGCGACSACGASDAPPRKAVENCCSDAFENGKNLK